MGFNELKHDMVIKWRRALNRLGIRQSKVFAIGFNKAGTSSLDALFHQLGRPSYHGTEWRACTDMKLLRGYDCFSDGIPKDLQKLDCSFSGSKFILQVRALDGWVYSRLGHIEKEVKKGTHKASDYWNNTEHAVSQWIVQRNEYHLTVLEYFANRPDDFLIVNFIRDQEAANKICQFLDGEGEYERPHVNVSSAKVPPAAYVEMLQRCAEKLGLPEEEMSCDLYCPSLVMDPKKLKYPKDSSELLG